MLLVKPIRPSKAVLSLVTPNIDQSIAVGSSRCTIGATPVIGIRSTSTAWRPARVSAMILGAMSLSPSALTLMPGHSAANAPAIQSTSRALVPQITTSPSFLAFSSSASLTAGDCFQSADAGVAAMAAASPSRTSRSSLVMVSSPVCSLASVDAHSDQFPGLGNRPMPGSRRTRRRRDHPGSYGIELALEKRRSMTTPVSRGEMLLVVQRNGALADHRLVVAGEAPVLLLGQLLPELAVEAGAHAGELAGLADAGGGVDAKAGVVDRQHPADQFDAAVAADPGIGVHPERRQHRLADAAEGAAVLATLRTLTVFTPLSVQVPGRPRAGSPMSLTNCHR